MARRARPRVVVTRADAPDAVFTEVLAGRGIDVSWVRTVAIVPPLEPGRLDVALAGLVAFDWVAFTSVHAVEATVQHPWWQAAWPALAARSRAPRLAAVGPSTAERLASFGFRAHLTAPVATGAGLASALVEAHRGTLAGVRILWPCSHIARPEFPDAARAAGARLSPVVAYRTVPVAPALLSSLRDDLAAGAVDAVAFFSPSAAASLADVLGDSRSLASLHRRTLVASVGPTTSATLHTLGAPPDLEAHPHTAHALATALAARLGA